LLFVQFPVAGTRAAVVAAPAHVTVFTAVVHATCVHGFMT